MRCLGALQWTHTGTVEYLKIFEGNTVIFDSCGISVWYLTSVGHTAQTISLRHWLWDCATFLRMTGCLQKAALGGAAVIKSKFCAKVSVNGKWKWQCPKWFQGLRSCVMYSWCTHPINKSLWLYSNKTSLSIYMYFSNGC